MLLADFMSAMNVLLFGALGVLALVDWIVCRCKNSPGWCWIKLAQALIGLYWCGIYIFVLFSPVGVYDPVWFGQTFIRPAFLLTAGIMLSSAIIGARRRKIIEHIKATGLRHGSDCNS